MATCLNKTVLVCDLRNFTSYTENNHITNVVSTIETIIQSLYKILEKHNGDYVNFTGDGLIFSYLNEADSIFAALEIRQFIVEFNKKAHKEKQSLMQVGIGIHKGTFCITKTKINEKNFNLVIGSSINIAAKLESSTKEHFVDIIVSQSVVDKVREQFVFLKLPNKKIGNIQKVYEQYWLAPSNKLPQGVSGE